MHHNVEMYQQHKPTLIIYTGEYFADCECQVVNPEKREKCDWTMKGITQYECEYRGCCWDNRKKDKIWCFKPRKGILI